MHEVARVESQTVRQVMREPVNGRLPNPICDTLVIMKFSPDKLPSEENSEISEHEWEALQEDADACMMLTKEHTPWSTVRSRSMHHILRNLEATPLLINFRRENGENI